LTPLPGSSSAFLVESQTLLPGSVVTLANGATVSNSPAGTPVVIPGTVPTPITIGGIVLTPIPGSSSVFVVGTQTISPGSVITLVNGVTVSISPAGTPIIIPGPASTTLATSANVLILDGQPITANPSSAFVIGRQTLVPGGSPITVSGTVISLGPGGTVVVIGGSTSTALGSIIASVFSGTTTSGTTASSTSVPVQYTGGVSKGVEVRLSVVVIMILVVLYV
jgi:hypothetical protein